MKEKINWHDKFFFGTFTQKDLMRDFLGAILDPEILKDLDLNVIDFAERKKVDKSLKESFTDLTVRVGFKNSKKYAELYFLVEHKSSPAPKIHQQLLKYMCSMFSEDLNKGNPARVIIPVVFYHGRRPWGTPARYSDVQKLPAKLKEYALDFKYILFNTADFELERDKNKFGGNSSLLGSLELFRAARHMTAEEYRNFLAFAHKNIQNMEFLEFMHNYFTNVNECIDENEIDSIIVSEFGDEPEEENTMCTLRQSIINNHKAEWMAEAKALGIIKSKSQLRAEARAEGRAEGIAEGIAEGETKGMLKKAIEMAKNALRKQLDPEMVAEISGLPLEQILELQKEL